MTRERAWVLLPSGRRLDLLNPDPTSWTDRDLAIGLSRTYRWGGYSRWDLPLSVAQHSLLVLVLRQQMRPFEILTRLEALRELLHDATEALIGGFDCIAPLKSHLGEPFAAIDVRLRAAVDHRYHLPAWSDEAYCVHKKADRLAAVSEAYHCTGWSRTDIRESLLITLNPVETDPLPTPDGMRPWQPWPPCLAAALFLAKLRELAGTDAVTADPSCLRAVVARENTIASLARRFSELAPAVRRKCTVTLTGSSLTDTYVYAEADDGSQSVDGVVIDGQKGEDGEWDFESDFTVFTTDGEVLVCHGDNCRVDIL